MKERPILFSGPMVRAILEGRKTQTRRITKVPSGFSWDNEAEGLITDGKCVLHLEEIKCPHGAVGDRLWVREAWGLWDTLPKDGPERARIFYRSTDSDLHECRHQLWRPSIHMPRWASRITLEITGVRVERLQEISEKDVAAEGTPGMICGRYQCEYCNGNGSSLGVTCGDCKGTGNDALSYWMDLWQSIHGQESWSANPWVWVIEFKRLDQ